MRLVSRVRTVELSDEELMEVLGEAYSVLKYALDDTNNVPPRIKVAAAETRDFLSELYNIGCPDE